jgi:hypothetical protein
MKVLLVGAGGIGIETVRTPISLSLSVSQPLPLQCITLITRLAPFALHAHPHPPHETSP